MVGRPAEYYIGTITGTYVYKNDYYRWRSYCLARARARVPQPPPADDDVKQIGAADRLEDDGAAAAVATATTFTRRFCARNGCRAVAVLSFRYDRLVPLLCKCGYAHAPHVPRSDRLFMYIFRTNIIIILLLYRTETSSAARGGGVSATESPPNTQLRS